MNRLEQIERVQSWFPKECSRKKRAELEKKLRDERTCPDIFNAWKNDENKPRSEKWHQFVRLAIDFEKVHKMYRRIRYLVYRYRNTHEYFRANFQNKKCVLPDRLSQLESFRDVSDDFFRIFHKINNQVNFDSAADISTNRTIYGKVNWDLTFKKSPALFPLQFETIQNKKNFSTSENILLIFCIMWLNRRSVNLLEAKFHDPLDDYEIKTLLEISNKTKHLLTMFPFHDVTRKVLEKSSLDPHDPFIHTLEKSTRERISDGMIQNLWYGQLIEWLQKFRSFDFATLQNDKLNGNFLLEATKNLDSLYEIWIFFEMIHHFNKYADITLNLDGTDQFFEFYFEDSLFQIFYEKTFSPVMQKAWALEHKPDFTVMVGDDIIAVFDAKNWKHKNDEENPLNKILAYMTNLDCGLGAILWPREPSSSQFPHNNTTTPKFHNKLKVRKIKLDPYDAELAGDYDSVFKDLFSEITSQLQIHVKK